MNPLVLLGALMTLAAVVAVLWPVFRRPREGARAPFSLAVYKDQLTEIEHDRARGLIQGAEATAARTEIERRILRTSDAVPAVPPRQGRVAAILAAALLPPLAYGLYASLGTPTMPDRPLASRQQEIAQAQGPDIGAMVARLEARLRETPDDLEGWLMLARSRSALGDAPGTAEAYRAASRLAADDPRAIAGLAEALVTGAGGMVTPEAATLLARLETLSPDDPRPGFYLGLAAAQAGDRDRAIERWRRLLAAIPASSPVRSRLDEAVRAAATDLGIDPATIVAAQSPSGPQAAPGPGPADVAAAEKMTPEARLAFIRSMVARLEERLTANPGDVEGWQRLAQARLVLGERDEARQAFERALLVHKDEPGLIKGLAELLLGPPRPDTGLPEIGDEALSLFERAASLVPDDPEAQWYLGIRALQEGNSSAAREHWQRVLARLEPTSPDFAAIQERLQRLGS